MGIKTGEVVEHDGTTHRAWLVRCPACGCPHAFDSRWTFNGNHEAPTFRNSMLVKVEHHDPAENTICHSYLTDGVWEYLLDCTHDMKGLKVDAPDWQGP